MVLLADRVLTGPFEGSGAAALRSNGSIRFFSPMWTQPYLNPSLPLTSRTTPTSTWTEHVVTRRGDAYHGRCSTWLVALLLLQAIKEKVKLRRFSRREYKLSKAVASRSRNYPAARIQIGYLPIFTARAAQRADGIFKNAGS